MKVFFNIIYQIYSQLNLTLKKELKNLLRNDAILKKEINFNYYNLNYLKKENFL